MTRLFACLALTGAFALAACDDPDAYEDREAAEVVVEDAAAPAAEDAAAPVAAPDATETPPVDSSTLPGEKRTSEESVKPESETLFY
jgi:hypothetical protein